ncbi:helix-turn-helix domain-containing protein [Microbacterium sp. AGC85]
MPESPLLAPVSEFVVRAGDAVDLYGFSAYRFEHLLQEMFLGLLIETSRPVWAASQRQPFTEALAVIALGFRDPALAPAAVAHEVRLSLRQLQRHFRERGTTIGREIRRTRVEQALAVLRDQGRDALSIDEVAESVGFSGGSSLARAMAAEGHVSPMRAARSLGNVDAADAVAPERAA